MKEQNFSFFFSFLTDFRLFLNANFKSEISFPLYVLVFMQFETCDFILKITW